MPHPKKQQVIRLSYALAVAEVMSLSIQEPHNVFYIAAIKCPSCNDHIAGFAAFDRDHKPKKYLVATIANGEVIPRRRH